LTVGGLAAAGLTAAVVVITVFGGQVASNVPAVAAPAAAPGGAPLVDLAAQAGDEGPLLSAADLAAMSGAPAAAKRAGRAAAQDGSPASSLASDGIPSTALLAYQQAAQREAEIDPACGLPWPLLAGIGRVESDHGRFAGATLHSDGLSTPPVIGIALNGHGTALIRDTDGGRLDGDTVYDRAVGPMQFIPSTWAHWGVDENGDGAKDPFNIFDAAAAAADYLCTAGRDLSTTHGQVTAILSYNYSYDYVSMVMGVERVYATQVGLTVPVLPTSPEPPSGPPKHKPPLPPVDPGTPRGAPPPSTTPSPAPSSSTVSGPAVPSTSPADPSPPDSSSDDPTTSDSPSGGPSPSDGPGDSPTPSAPPPSDSSDSPGGSSGPGSAGAPGSTGP
jgi:membrane-bound lytic murein transglycosylase B